MKIPRDAVSAAEWRALGEAAIVHLRDEARFRVAGRGALDCLQGLITTDLKELADGARGFGALLTAKGMIVAPLWIARYAADQWTLETPHAAAAVLEETLRKSLPPRLAQFEDVTAITIGFGLYGPLARPLGGALPAVVRGARGFDGEAVDDLLDGLPRAGEALLETCRILSGIPKLGAEIDDKTLPQEVRFEDLGAVSYTKGCYLGQETVARVHFRGHPNRRLALVLLSGEPPSVPLELKQGDKPVGRLTSACWSDELDQWVGQAVIRREVEHHAELAAGVLTATVNLERWLREP